jgi:N-acetylmuramic acid 6-phosphate etherase
MSADQRSDEFLQISSQFKLGALVTESSHPVTGHLSEMARQDAAAGLKLLLDVDGDVIRKFREFVESGRAGEIKETLVRSLKNGGRIFFTGCGATGRLSILLDSVWRDFWQQQRPGGFAGTDDFENRTFSVMAGGDYALIKSVEGFEDFAAFGRKQLRDLGVRAGDVVFAITEGGETSFVIGTAWEGVDTGAKVYFLYNNPDDILCQTVERSREVIGDTRIEKMNLTTGPMAIAGSTRMQATSIQLCVMLTILEMVVRELAGRPGTAPVSEIKRPGDGLETCPREFLARLEELYAGLKSPELLAQLAKLVALEETVYRNGHRNNYFAGRFGIDVLTDTTERSPTYCTPPFRKAGDTTAAESWAFLFLPQGETPEAWRFLLRREPRCVEWSEGEVRELMGHGKFARTMATIRKIGRTELMQFKIGLDGVRHRPPGKDDCAVVIAGEAEISSLLSPDGFFYDQLEMARKAGARTGLICFYSSRGNGAASQKSATGNLPSPMDQSLLASAEAVLVPVPGTDFLLDGVTRVAVKLVMNALSTCTMVRLGRVMGNTMIWVVPSNLKLIDRATRYIGKLTGLTYERSNRLLFEVLEYVEPRLKADQAYPPVVGLAVMRARHHCSNAEAERKLTEEIK